MNNSPKSSNQQTGNQKLNSNIKHGERQRAEQEQCKPLGTDRTHRKLSY